MLTLRLKLSRDRILIIICALLAVLSMVWHFVSFSNILPKGDTTSERTEFIKQLGYEPSADSETHKTIYIPQKFDNVYSAYNEIQLSVGFDLSRYRGCGVELYTYKLADSKDIKDATANLIVYRKKIIGGDIATLHNGGRCLPLTSHDGNTKNSKESKND